MYFCHTFIYMLRVCALRTEGHIRAYPSINVYQRNHNMLPCPLYQLTHLQCPFCGLQRAAVALWQGHWQEAFWLNPGMLILLPAFIAWWLTHRPLTPAAALTMLIVSLCWGLARNLLGI